MLWPGLIFLYEYCSWSISVSWLPHLGKICCASRNNYLQRHFRASDQRGYSTEFHCKFVTSSAFNKTYEMSGFHCLYFRIWPRVNPEVPGTKTQHSAVLLVFGVKNTIYCDVKPCCLADMYQRFRNLTTKQHGVASLKTVVVKPKENWKVN